MQQVLNYNQEKMVGRRYQFVVLLNYLDDFLFKSIYLPTKMYLYLLLLEIISQLWHFLHNPEVQ